MPCGEITTFTPIVLANKKNNISLIFQQPCMCKISGLNKIKFIGLFEYLTLLNLVNLFF